MTPLPEPKWLRIKDAVRYSGLSRTMIYELIKSNSIKTANLSLEGRKRGVRLISVESLDEFIEQFAAA